MIFLIIKRKVWKYNRKIRLLQVIRVRFKEAPLNSECPAPLNSECPCILKNTVLFYNRESFPSQTRSPAPSHPASSTTYSSGSSYLEVHILFLFPGPPLKPKESTAIIVNTASVSCRKNAVSFFFFKFIFIYLVELGLSCGMHVRSSSLARDQTPSALRVWSLNHCATRQVPKVSFFSPSCCSNLGRSIPRSIPHQAPSDRSQFFASFRKMPSIEQLIAHATPAVILWGYFLLE